jgi:predicted nucleotide-binding protein
MIKANAQSVGFLKPVKDKTFVDLGAQPTPQAAPTVEGAEPIIELVEQPVPQPPAVIPPAPERTDGLRNRRVYISHGKNLKIVQHLKDLISYGELEPVVSVETESPSKPVPKKVMDDMRSCSAGIIHVSGEETLTDGSGKERHIVNQNVLIEIGAAMALYGDRFILLVEEGASLPSNLQGLYEVRYSGGGSELGHEATMRLLKIFAEFKSGPSS